MTHYALMMMLMMISSCCGKEPTTNKIFSDSVVMIDGNRILCPCGKNPNHIYILNGIQARCQACLEGEVGYSIENCFWYEDYFDGWDMLEEQYSAPWYDGWMIEEVNDDGSQSNPT